MKYKLKVGPSTEFYYSSMEKAALAMRALVEADGGSAYIPYTLATKEDADVRLEPIWPERSMTPEIDKIQVEIPKCHCI